MTAVEKITERLQKYPELRYRAGGNSITIEPPSPTGFSVSLFPGPAGYTVAFDGWHEEFDSEDHALGCVAFGLSDQARLKVYRRGKWEYCWTLQCRTDDRWVEESTTGLLLFPFWRKRETLDRQNTVVSGEARR